MINKLNLFDKIISPIVTEKSTYQSQFGKVIFKVPRNSNKISIKKSIEKIFKVNVTKVNIINKQNIVKHSRGKKIKKKGYKKAIVTLKKGQNIDLTSGI